MDNQNEQTFNLPKYLLPLLIASILLSFIAVVISVLSLVQSINETKVIDTSQDAKTTEIGTQTETATNQTKEITEEDNSAESPLDENIASYLFEWPPKEILIEESGCYDNEIVTIYDQQFCRWVQNEGAAGSTYTTYTYNPSFMGGGYAYSFVVRFVSDCNVLEGKMVQQCEQEKADFDPDELFYDFYQALNE